MPTDNTYRYTLAVVFDGIGSDTSETEGLAWAYGPAPDGASNLEWKSNYLVRLPESVDTGVNPLSGEFSTSAFDFELSMNDDVATTFLHQSTAPEYKLSVALTAAGTSVTITDLAGTAANYANTAVWVGDECILLGSYSGAGVHTGCTRGFWNTYATTHIVDTYVHQSPNYWRFRGVRLVVHDRDDASERTLWRGWVDSMSTSENGTTLSVSCTEVLQSLQNATINRGASNFAEKGLSLRSSGADVICAGAATIPAKARKISSYEAWFQVGDGLFSGTYSVGIAAFIGTASKWESLRSDDYTSELERVDSVHELFVVDGFQSSSASSTGSLTNPFHPVEIAMALLTSTRSSTVNVGAQAWDGLGGDWGLGIPLGFFDLDQIESIINETIDVKIGRLLLGWDGEEVDVLSVINEKLLRPYGFFISITTDGKISFRQLRLFTVTDQDINNQSVSALPNTLRWNAARSNAVQQVVAEVGALPWRDPDMLSVAGRDGTLTDSLRSALFGEKTTYALDFSTQVDERDVRSIAIDRLKYAYYAMPTLTITVGDEVVTGATYDLGDVITPIIDTQSGWLVKSDGTRASATGDTVVDSQFAGPIVGRTINLVNMTYTLTLLLTNYRNGGAVYLRPPSGVVVSVNGGGSGMDCVVEANAFHSTAADASKFSSGNSVAFWTPDGTLREGGHSIASTPVGNTIELNAATVSVVAGDIMRVDDYDQPASPDNYNYMADSNGKLGAANDDGRRYA